MSVRAYVQVKQPEYGNCRLSSWAQHSSYEYMNGKGINIYTGDAGDDADRWEIEVADRSKIAGIIADLRDNPNCLDPDGEKREYALDLAALLEEGLEAAEKNNYDYIIIEWF